jgi:hypothetical protein
MSRKKGTPNKKKTAIDIGNIPKVALDKNGNPDFGSCLTPSDKIEQVPVDLNKTIYPSDMKHKYFILTENNIYGLGIMVRQQLENGYVCQGGVSVTNYRALDGKIVMVYCQAMIRKEM